MSLGNEPLFMISIVAQLLSIHPQTLRLYEREGFVKPSRTDGNTRLYSEQDIEQVKLILRLTRELGVNLAGVEVILSMREKMEEMHREISEMRRFIELELRQSRKAGEEERKSGLVKVSPGEVVKVEIERR
ncbi:MAG: helix-turn-helix transcriptional regulator [Candidatus Tectomicrobia bacterium]|nr:helix-turn-helix transcriptional regulator [Candidatus Tectomicrobia bacterium]